MKSVGAWRGKAAPIKMGEVIITWKRKPSSFTTEQFRDLILKKIRNLNADDPAHDISHLMRVWANGMKINESYYGSVVGGHAITAACLLHDFVNVPKDAPLKDRANASLLSANAADKLLREILEGDDFPDEFFSRVHGAIVTHSYSLGRVPDTIEGQIVQDADRLDALGAIGIARCFSVGSSMNKKRGFYCINDPFCENRTPDDSTYTLDHFYTKLLNLHKTFNTNAAKLEAMKRTQFMRDFLNQLKMEISVDEVVHAAPGVAETA